MNLEFNVEKKSFDKEGYLLIKNVFNKEEISQIRKNAYNSLGEDNKRGLTFRHPSNRVNAVFVKGDLLSKDSLRHLIWDERILSIVKQVLGGSPVYFGDSNYQFGLGFRGFHRDNVDRNDLTASDWDSEYPLVRIGIYLQDHKRFSGGLKVKIGSHINKSGKSVIIDSEEGDLVVWNLRTIHSGNAVRLKIFNNFSIDRARIEAMIPSYLKLDEQKERVSLFLTYGLKSKHLDRYIEKHVLGREDIKSHLKASKFDLKVFELAKQNKLEILKLIPEYGSLD
jgi:hypothetical protein